MQPDFLKLPLRTEKELDAEAAFEAALTTAIHNQPTATEIHDALGGTEPSPPPRPDARPVTARMIAEGYTFDD
jgi:hypothetical protein